ncbi:MAG: tetratricopeptide repeat protein, partial [Thermoplasmata archaeon]|nr:tetratricopeptide repeat protein [Thermoplasmata archaeon]NIS12402.1 tetratricopeptide repeat protein [Thermoplasmata archaeon]NIS20321.1 tetratricopeptide repeat protein [Thermoplasmata archaeon]NIT77664.1 tetratricopeptide repeat protein [Thermoplasmata archaeon]NIU49409.1 tetratricopeptide repeat protein [Thermoplasmata archaeon]
YDKCIQLTPGNANAWYNRGALLKRMGRVEEGEEAMARARSLEMGEDD